MTKYYVFKKGDEFLALAYMVPVNNQSVIGVLDDLSQFNFYISQGFSYYDAGFNIFPACVWANNPNEAISIAKQIFSLNDLNKLRSRIYELEMEVFQLKSRGFPSIEEDPYAILGVTKQTPKKQIKSQYHKLVKALNDKFPDGTGTTFLMQKLNGAWEVINKEI